MRRILLVLATMVMGVLLASGVALAAVVSEVEPNQPLAQAQALPADAFDLTANTDITDSTTLPHATVNGGGDPSDDGSENDTIDYYSFTVPAGNSKRVYLDIDHTTPDFVNESDPQYDPWIELYDSRGNLLAFSDDDPGDAGSTTDDPNGRDSFIQTALARGTYYVGVGSFEGLGPVPDTATYQLHVSIGDDTIAPTVSGVFPDQDQTDVNPAANVEATFSEEVQGVTKSTFTLERVVLNKRGVEQFRGVRAQVSTFLLDRPEDTPPYVSIATLDPANDLQSGEYRVTITSRVTDMVGNPLGLTMWRFTVVSPPPA
jgi:hypothetical protein